MNNQAKTIEKSIINKFTIAPSGYGHWKISIEAENPNLKLPESDYYWTINDREDEPETIQICHITTDSKAIDNEDECALAHECFIRSDFSIEDFDLSSLKSIKMNKQTKTSEKFILSHYQGKGFLVKSSNGNYEVSTGSDFENEEDFIESIKKFDTIEEANSFIRETDYYSLDAVGFEVIFPQS